MARFGRWSVGALTLVGLALGLGFAGVTSAQQPLTLPMQVTENRAPGAAGQVTMTPLGTNQVRVDIRITGLRPSAMHAAHIHGAQGARCDTNSPVIYPLTNVQSDASGVGTSTTTLTLTANQPVQAGNSYVNVHEPGGNPGAGIICANVTQTFAAGGAAQAGGQGAAAMPRTGTGLAADTQSQGWMLAGLAVIAILIGGVGALAATRRR